MSEGEFLEITEIKRQQAEDYECITNNGVAPPDQRKVKVTVNCKYQRKVTNTHPISGNKTANALLCMNSNVLILFSPGVSQPCGLIQADLSRFLREGRCLLIAEFPLVFSSFPTWVCLPDPPMITDMKNMPAHLGKTAILRCEAMAVPPASFEWYRDDHR